MALAALAFSTIGLFARAAYAGDGTPLDLLVIRYVVASVVLWPTLALAGVPLRRPPRQTAALLALGIIYAASAYGMFLALEHLPVGLTILLFFTYPVLVNLFSWLLGERPSRSRLGALGLAVAGLVLMVRFDASGAEPQWMGAALSAALLVACFQVIAARLLRACPAPVMLAHVQGASALVYLAVGAAVAVPLQLSLAGWAAAVALGLIPSALAMGLVLAGVARVGPSRGAIVSTLEPLLATLWAALLLGERLAPLQLVGGALIVGALGVLALAPRAEQPSAQAKSATS